MLHAGHVTGRIFSSWSTEFHVLKIKLKNFPPCEAVFNGINPPVISADEHMFSGFWTGSKIYGNQFHIKAWETMADHKKTRNQYLSQIRTSLDQPDLFQTT